MNIIKFIYDTGEKEQFACKNKKHFEDCNQSYYIGRKILSPSCVPCEVDEIWWENENTQVYSLIRTGK